MSRASGEPDLRDRRKFAPKIPAFPNLIVGAAAALAAASAWTPRLVTPAHAQTSSPTEVQIEGVRSVATSRAVANFSDLAADNLSDLAANRSLAGAAKYPVPTIAIHRPLMGHAGEALETDEGFGANALGDVTDNTGNRTVRRRNRRRVREIGR